MSTILAFEFIHASMTAMKVGRPPANGAIAIPVKLNLHPVSLEQRNGNRFRIEDNADTESVVAIEWYRTGKV
jgi:hypothetical protein